MKDFTWTHRKKGKLYQVMHQGKVRRRDGSWKPCVVYTPTEKDHPMHGTVFTREMDDFRLNFKAIQGGK